MMALSPQVFAAEQTQAPTQIEQALQLRGAEMKIEILPLLELETQKQMHLKLKRLKIWSGEKAWFGSELKLLDSQQKPLLSAYFDRPEIEAIDLSIKRLQQDAAAAQSVNYFEQKYVSLDGLEMGFYYLPKTKQVEWFLRKDSIAVSLSQEEVLKIRAALIKK